MRSNLAGWLHKVNRAHRIFDLLAPSRVTGPSRLSIPVSLSLALAGSFPFSFHHFVSHASASEFLDISSTLHLSIPPSMWVHYTLPLKLSPARSIPLQCLSPVSLIPGSSTLLPSFPPSLCLTSLLHLSCICVLPSLHPSFCLHSHPSVSNCLVLVSPSLTPSIFPSSQTLVNLAHGRVPLPVLNELMAKKPSTPPQ
ncbi:hypothetical protein P692DRAFT_20879183 [Suillus brevipes Sb2]|nr:hypothetical protein P692DRAFT_20879183 [Suillus brevipes Sb2]